MFKYENTLVIALQKLRKQQIIKYYVRINCLIKLDKKDTYKKEFQWSLGNKMNTYNELKICIVVKGSVSRDFRHQFFA